MIETGRWVSQIEKTAERIWLKLDSTLEPSWPKSKDLPQDHNNIPTGWWSTLWIRSVIYYILHIAVLWILVKLCEIESETESMHSNAMSFGHCSLTSHEKLKTAWEMFIFRNQMCNRQRVKRKLLVKLITNPLECCCGPVVSPWILVMKDPGSNPALVWFSLQSFGFETPTCQFLSYLFHHFLPFGEACLEKLRAPQYSQNLSTELIQW